MALNITFEKTRLPKVKEQLLAPNVPVEAWNNNNENLNLTPRKGFTYVSSLDFLEAIPKTMFYLRDKWMYFTDLTHVIRAQGPFSDDKFYFTDSKVYLTPRQATSAFLFSTSNLGDGHYVTIQKVDGSTVKYTFRATPSAAYEVKLGTSSNNSSENLVYAINADPEHTDAYGAGTVAHPNVVATHDLRTVNLTACEDTAPGAVGNGIGIYAWVSSPWGGIIYVSPKSDTLTGGVDGGWKNFPAQSDYTDAFSGAPVTYPTESRRLGVTYPTEVLTVNEHGYADTSKDAEITAYTYTYVTEDGEESKPAPVSPVITVDGGKWVSLQNFQVPQDSAIQSVRIYRLVAGLMGTSDYFLIPTRPSSAGAQPIMEIPISSITGAGYQVYDSNHASTPSGLSQATGESLQTEGWEPAPENLSYLTQHISGVIMGAYQNTIHFSEPLIPYAWPLDYQYHIDTHVKALGVYKSSAIILTDSNPYVIHGSSPDRMVLDRLSENQACVSERGVVPINMGVVYPSDSGLMLANDMRVMNLTEHLFTSSQWRATSPETILGVYFNNQYIGFYEGTSKGFILDLNSAPPQYYDFDMGETDISVWAVKVLNSTNDLYFVGQDGTSEGSLGLYTWGTGADLTYTWMTKPIVTQRTNWEVFRIKGPFDKGNIEVTPYFNDVAQPKITVEDERVYWLPSGKTYTELKFKLEGTSAIDMLFLGHSPEELIHGY